MRSGFLALILCCALATMVKASDAPAVPWEAAGLDERAAAVHLLERFTWGPRPGDVERVLELGLERWLEHQIAGGLPFDAASPRTWQYQAERLPEAEIVRRYAHRHYIVQEAIGEEIVSLEAWSGQLGEDAQRDAYAALQRYIDRQGFRPERELEEQLQARKLYRALAARGQLIEVLSDFWLNHFNVARAKPSARVHLLAYERDAITPNVLGRFRDLLGAVARHPAMLHYLDNARSSAEPRVTTTLDLRMRPELDRFSPSTDAKLREQIAMQLGWRPDPLRRAAAISQGLNENYARELLELHTLGVDGGYTQHDVREVARAFTGWTVLPVAEPTRSGLQRLARFEESAELGLVLDGELLFQPGRHDAEEKHILGILFPAEGGIEDGEAVLDLLATHPSTARHLATKLATRFVADDPPPAVVERLSRAYQASDGDLAVVMRALFAAPELWRAATQRRKVKTPFGVAVSALRALDADLPEPDGVLAWLRRAGQPLYGYGAPTGYPDDAASWVQAGPMVERINFGFALAGDEIDGVALDLLDLVGREPLTSLDGALEVYAPIVLPGRDVSDLREWLARQAPVEEAPVAVEGEVIEDGVVAGEDVVEDPAKQARRFAVHAVGLLLASPEFQKY